MNKIRKSISFAVAVRRGSMTTSRPPRFFCRSNHCMIGGSVSAEFAPTRTTSEACSMSATGNGSPRSTPNARLPPAAPEDMQ